MRFGIRIRPRLIIIPLLLAAVPLLHGSTAGAAETGISVAAGSVWSSNVYADASREWDHALVPTLDAWIDFADVWTVSYAAALDWFARHDELLSHSHRLEVSASPEWRVDRDAHYELSASVAVDTLRNTPAFADLNNVRVETTVAFAAEPVAWLRLRVWGEAGVRLFYDDRRSDAIDGLAGGSATFTLPTRTTLTPRIAGGGRWYLRKAASGGRSDMQVEPAIHLSQGLWETGGLQADYAWHGLIGGSSELARKISQDQFSWLGEEFMTGGHRILAGFTQVIAGVVQADASVEYRTRSYAGWPATDAAGALTGSDRADRRLSVATGMVWAWQPDEGAGTAVPGIDLALRYSYARQWSNSVWYDTDIHSVSFSAASTW